MLSARAKAVLEPFLLDHCEWLPWVNEPDHQYWLINCVTNLPRALWRCEVSSSYGVAVSADEITIMASSVPPMFRLEGYRGKLFVSDEIAQLSVRVGLKGVIFTAPRIHALNFLPKSFGKRRTGFVTDTEIQPPLEH